MAARFRKIAHDDTTRAKIQTSQMVNALVDHVNGRKKMTSTQVRAAEILLRKTMPDLQSIEMIADHVVHRVARVPLTREEWQSKYAMTAVNALPALPAPAAKTNGGETPH